MPYNLRVSNRTALYTTTAVVAAVYLTAAGWFFVLAPWSRFWTARVVAAAPAWLTVLLAEPAFRGAVSGFGAIHFAAAWGWLERATEKM